jgi:hypothetical protein
MITRRVGQRLAISGGIFLEVCAYDRAGRVVSIRVVIDDQKSGQGGVINAKLTPGERLKITDGVEVELDQVGSGKNIRLAVFKGNRKLRLSERSIKQWEAISAINPAAEAGDGQREEEAGPDGDSGPVRG